MASWMTGCKPTKYPGIFETRNGYRIRVRAVSPKTGTLKERNEEVVGISIRQALTKQEELRSDIRRGRADGPRDRVRYADYAESLLRKKLAKRKFRSKKGKRTWTDLQDLHLVPAFGDWFVDEIRTTDIDAWVVEQCTVVIDKGGGSPNTVNNRLRCLLATLRAAVRDLQLPNDPTRGVELVDTSTWQTYTEEEPNSLTVAEVPLFMAAARQLYPQHYAMVTLGLVIGRRPGELRPLRRKGARPDVLWDEGVVLIRRSEGLGEAAETTKTKVRLRIPLPGEIMEILKWHVASLPEGPMGDSDLLFPSLTGGFRSASCLDKPIRKVAEAAKINKHLTPYFMRRTFQDLCRAAKVHDFVARAISGHATVEMQQLYSTVGAVEVQEGLARVISLAGFAAKRSGDASGDGAQPKGSAGEAAA